MVFWIGILVGGLFAWLAIRIGFYETWVMLFNIVISIYLAIHLQPLIADFVPTSARMLYSNALIVMATAIASFLTLHGITYVLFTSQFRISFPKVFDILGAGLLGFFAGFTVWSFASFLVCITPISQNTLVKEFGFNRQQANVSSLCWWCNLVNGVVSRPDDQLTTEKLIDSLLKTVEKKPRLRRTRRAGPTRPANTNESTEPNKVQTNLTDETAPRTSTKPTNSLLKTTQT